MSMAILKQRAGVNPWQLLDVAGPKIDQTMAWPGAVEYHEARETDTAE